MANFYQQAANSGSEGLHLQIHCQNRSNTKEILNEDISLADGMDAEVFTKGHYAVFHLKAKGRAVNTFNMNNFKKCETFIKVEQKARS